MLSLLLSALLLGPGAAAQSCESQTQPNPIASLYPDLPTGVINATLAVVPISLKAARVIVPPQWAILEGAYRALLPAFPAGMYPVILQAALDHDVQVYSYNAGVPDFPRVSFEFPFIDLLGDGYSSFRWSPEQLIADNAIALNGSEKYGAVVHPATFDPPCDAYARQANGSATFRAQAADGSGLFAALDFAPLPPWLGRAGPYPLDFFGNVTNQPMFSAANGTCDKMVRLFNTSVTEGAYAPVPVWGQVVSNLPPLGQGGQGVLRRKVLGVQVATSFIEYNYLNCSTLQGYPGSGSQA